MWSAPTFADDRGRAVLVYRPRGRWYNGYEREVFPEREFQALVALSKRELRPVPDQVRMILRDRLRRAGLLTTNREVAHVGADR